MENVVPSKDMRQYFEKVGFELSDFQKATILWNRRGWTLEQRLEALRELAETTEDEMLRQQILERLQYEEKVRRVFAHNDGQYVYVVCDWPDGYPFGYFRKYEMARKYAMDSKERTTILKQLVVQGEELPKVELVIEGNPNMLPESERNRKGEELKDYNGYWIAEMGLKPTGEVVFMNSHELPREEREAVFEFKEERFEEQFFKIPFDMPKGAIVRDTATGNRGILCTDKVHWHQRMKKIENIHKDYSDIRVAGLELTERGYWSHFHINPMELELVKPGEESADPDFPEEEPTTLRSKEYLARKWEAKMRAEEAFSDYLRHEPDPEKEKEILALCREYATICKEKSLLSQAVYKAESLNELIL